MQNASVQSKCHSQLYTSSPDCLKDLVTFMCKRVGHARVCLGHLSSYARSDSSLKDLESRRAFTH